MQEIHVLERVAKQMVDERRRQAQRDALAARHSRSGLILRFLAAIARREVR